MCDIEQCPHCATSQPLEVCALGVLGSRVHFRCRYCGGGWSSHVNSLPVFEDQADDEPLLDEFA